MCQRVSCPHCGKPTWKGCGMHIQRALQDVLFEDRCPNWPEGASKPCNYKHNTQVATKDTMHVPPPSGSAAATTDGGLNRRKKF